MRGVFFHVRAREAPTAQLGGGPATARTTSKSASFVVTYFIVVIGLVGVGPPAALAQAGPPVGGFVSVGVGALWPSGLTLVGKTTDGIDTAQFISTYSAGTTPLVDVSGGVLIRRRFMVGMGVSRAASRRAGRLAVELTHPAFHSTITGTTDTAPLERTQLTWHWDAGYQFHLGSRLNVTVLGGPARIQVTRRLIDDLDFEEDVDFRTGQWSILGPAYAADTVQQAQAWGYHVATDVTYRISPRLGVGALARYTRASVGYDNPIQARIDDQPVTTKDVTSGLEVSGGLRLGLAPSVGDGRSMPPRWEIEGHVGTGWGDAPAGEGTVPAVGVAFTTFNGNPSRTVPSWYLREGADLFNNNATSRGAGTRLTPVDSVLDTSSVRLPQHVPVGMRVARLFGGRLAAEFTIDISNGGPEITQDARDRLEPSNSIVREARQRSTAKSTS
jgi:hypothetical protein